VALKSNSTTKLSKYRIKSY